MYNTDRLSAARQRGFASKMKKTENPEII